METTELKKGALLANLTKSFGETKRTVAESLHEDFEIGYKRYIEDLCKAIRSCDRERENQMLQLIPNTPGKMIDTADISVNQFLENDVQTGINKRKYQVKLMIALERYEYLFGTYPDMVAVEKALPNKDIASLETEIGE